MTGLYCTEKVFYYFICFELNCFLSENFDSETNKTLHHFANLEPPFAGSFYCTTCQKFGKVGLVAHPNSTVLSSNLWLRPMKRNSNSEQKQRTSNFSLVFPLIYFLLPFQINIDPVHCTLFFQGKKGSRGQFC